MAMLALDCGAPHRRTGRQGRRRMDAKNSRQRLFFASSCRISSVFVFLLCASAVIPDE
jgi:hypothetical protein